MTAGREVVVLPPPRETSTTTTPLTPWSSGAPPLRVMRSRPRRFGFVPTRRQVLAGYVHPPEVDADGKAFPAVRVRGQVERALDRLGADATIEEVADSIAVWAGDRDFLGVLFDSQLIDFEDCDQ